MVKKMEYMGEENSSYVMRKIDNYFIGFYRMLPFTYLGTLRGAFRELEKQKERVTVLDLGCGDGTATQNLAFPKNFQVTGVDIFRPYLKLARKKKIYKKLINADVARFSSKTKYDIVMALHILEHFDKKAGVKLLMKMEKLAKKRVVVVMPVGFLPQSEYDKNPHQLHKSSWMPKEMVKRGYKVRAQGLKILWGNENIVSRYGLFSYFFFLLSALSTPLMRLNPRLGTYMICEKEMEK